MLNTARLLLGLLLLASAAVGLGSRYVPITNHVILGIAALSPIVMLAAPAAVLLFVTSRNWPLAGCATALTGALILTQAPLFIPATKLTGGSRELRVMTANIYLGQADPAALIKAASSADVLSVQELTPQAVQRLSAAGIDKVFPYHVLDARPEASGTGFWSRFPVTDPRTVGHYSHAMVAGRISVPGVAVDPTVFAAHLPGPFPYPVDEWNNELADLVQILSHVADDEGSDCVVVAGDFNSTNDMKVFRSLLAAGFRDGAEQAGAGLIRTYPVNIPRIPPVIGIDHVLTHQCAVPELQTIALLGSDHRGLIATISIPER